MIRKKNYATLLICMVCGIGIVGLLLAFTKKKPRQSISLKREFLNKLPKDVKETRTRFSIKAHKNDTNTYITLVEGKIAVNTVMKKEVLTPNQQSNLDLQNNNITIATVDASDEVSWKEGRFSFRKESLKDVMMELSRWYDMTVIFENKHLENVKYEGAFNKDLPIQDVLSLIKNTHSINNYEINDKTIILK